MNHRELATALAALSAEQVEALTVAADSIRRTEETLAGLGVKKRRKRGPNKPKPEPEPVAAPAKRVKRTPPAPKPLASALERLQKVKAGGVKVRRAAAPRDEDD